MSKCYHLFQCWHDHNNVKQRSRACRWGICVETECLQSKPPCFFQSGYKPLVNHSLIDTIHVNVFDDSIKYFAGDNLFGSSIDYCYMIDNPKHKAKHSTEMFKKILNNTINLYSITSLIPSHSMSLLLG